MRKQVKGRKPEIIGKGQVTPLQIAFIVDRYLIDTNCIEARSRFRSECSLISGSPAEYAPSNLMSLEQIMEEYIALKGQKKMLDSERVFLANDRSRTINLIQGMQSVMNTYSLSSPAPPRPPIVHSSSFHTNPMIMASTIGSPADCCVPNTPSTTTPVPIPITAKTPLTAPTPRPSNKRKGSKVTNSSAKKACSSSKPMESPSQALVQANNNNQEIFQECYIPKTSLPHPSAPKVSIHHESGVARASSSSPETPPQTICSEIDECKSSNSAQNNAPNNVSSMKKVTQESTVCSSSQEEIDTTRRIVKGKLDFDTCVDVPLENPIGAGNSASEPEDFDAFDIIEAFGADFDFSDLLVNFDDLDNGIELAQKSNDGTFEATVEGILSEKDMNIEAGSEVMEYRNSVAKPIEMSSPSRNQASSAMDQENGCTPNQQ